MTRLPFADFAKLDHPTGCLILDSLAVGVEDNARGAQDAVRHASNPERAAACARHARREAHRARKAVVRAADTTDLMPLRRRVEHARASARMWSMRAAEAE